METINFNDSLNRVDKEFGQPIIVPQGIRYISDWEEYDKSYLFSFPHILDKKIPGCGFTEYCIRNNRNIILCSPRKILLQNKFDQHKEDVFLVINELDVSHNVDIDFNAIGKNTERKIGVSRYDPDKEEQKELEQLSRIKAKSETQYRKLYFELLEYKSRMLSKGKPMKILVTYDSYHIVKNILGPGDNGLTGFGIFDQFYTVVDEFQSVFLDAVFKSDTELKFVRDLQNVQKVCYVSATPMIGTYLAMLPEFKDLPYYYLDWGTEQPERISKPDLKIHTIQSIVTAVRGIVNKYRSGKTDIKVVGENLIQSREAVIYLNSVNNICSIISRIGLAPEEVNILCADTSENRSRLKKKLGDSYSIGKIPLLGQPRKMFTFCTRTVYLGADFYSDNAKTYILSDANIDCMVVDISLDLPQILGRQRLNYNPWKNTADFYYIPFNLDKRKTVEEFRSLIEAKLAATSEKFGAYTSAEEDYKGVIGRMINSEIKLYNYKKDYVSVKKVYNEEMGTHDFVPVENKLVYIADLRAYDVQQKDYADRFSVFTAIDLSFDTSSVSPHVRDFFTVYDTLTNFTDKARFLCESDSLFTNDELNEILRQIDPLLGDCYRCLGRDLIIGYSYNITSLRSRLKEAVVNTADLKERVMQSFKVGDRLSKVFIRAELGRIYESLNYSKTPKATDLSEWFELKSGKFKDSTGKWENGFEIISLKP